jgi:hypothetical protein
MASNIKHLFDNIKQMFDIAWGGEERSEEASLPVQPDGQALPSRASRIHRVSGIHHFPSKSHYIWTAW